MNLPSRDLKVNMELLAKELFVDENFDLIYRVIEIGGKNACFYCVDGFAKDDVLQRLMQFFLEIKKEDMPADAHGMSKFLMPYGEIDLKEKLEDIIKNLLSGITVLFIVSLIIFNSSIISTDVTGSSDATGSSAKIISASWNKVLAIDTRCCSPPDNCAGKLFTRSPSPPSSKTVFASKGSLQI